MESEAYIQFAEEERTHWWFRGRRAIFCHFFPKLLAASSDANGGRPRILDLGCGTGGMLTDLAEHGDTFGLDVAQDALRYCTQDGHRRVFKGHGQHLPFADASLDLITALDTIEHIPEEMETLAECFRVLRPGGHLFLSAPAYQWLYTHQDKMVHHQRRYTVGGLRRKLESIGFETSNASYINFLLFPVILPVVLAIKLKQAIFRPDEKGEYFSNASIKVPRWVHTLLFRIFSVERHLISALPAPAGHSLMVIGRKPPAGG